MLDPPDALTRDIQRALLRQGPYEHPTLSLSEQIGARLAWMIATDRIQPGQRLVEEEICRTLQVSRAPVREALRILERDRLLAVVPRRGAHVTTPSADELRDIFEVRASLWAALMEHIVENLRDEASQTLAEGLRELRSASGEGSAEAYSMASFALTIRLCDLCSNQLLREMVQSVALQTFRYSRIGFRETGAIARSLRGWSAIARAAAIGDSAAAGAAARMRVLGSRDASLRGVSHAGAASARRGPATANANANATRNTRSFGENNDGIDPGAPQGAGRTRDQARTRDAARRGRSGRGESRKGPAERA